METRVSGNFTICEPDMEIIAETSERALNITLCKCNSGSETGVTIIKEGTNYPISITVDEHKGVKQTSLVDGGGVLDCLFIGHTRSRPVTLMYNSVTNTWRQQRK